MNQQNGVALAVFPLQKEPGEFDVTRAIVRMPVGAEPFAVVPTKKGLALCAIVGADDVDLMPHRVVVMPDSIKVAPRPGYTLGKPIGTVIHRGSVAAVVPELPWPTKADANAVVTWAPQIIDWKGPLHLVGDKYVRPKRYQTLAECMGESLDYTDGPASIDLYQLLINAAAGADVQAQANELLGRMAVVFAKFNAEAY